GELTAARMSDTIIMLGKGLSAHRAPEILARYPDARVWAFAGVHHPRLSLQFEIHYGNALDDIQPGPPVIVSPFPHRRSASSVSPVYPFPLDAAVSLGHPYFESSIDYLLAYAALARAARLPRNAPEWRGRLPRRIV